MRAFALGFGALLALTAAFVACSSAPDDYCDTPGVCVYADGAAPDVKKDSSDAAAKDGTTADATSD